MALLGRGGDFVLSLLTFHPEEHKSTKHRRAPLRNSVSSCSTLEILNHGVTMTLKKHSVPPCHNCHRGSKFLLYKHKILIEELCGKKKSLNNPQLRIIQHDLLLAVVLKLYSSHRVVQGTFHLQHLTETEFLVLYSLSCLQVTRITCNEIR